MTTYPLILEAMTGERLALTRVEVKESKLEFNDVEGQAAESAVQQVAGDGQRKPHWKEFDTWLTTGPRPQQRAAALAAFEGALRFVVRAQMDGLTYPIDRIRVVSRTPTAQGYRLSLRMIGPQPDFIDAGGNPAPLW